MANRGLMHGLVHIISNDFTGQAKITLLIAYLLLQLMSDGAILTSREGVKNQLGTLCKLIVREEPWGCRM